RVTGLSAAAGGAGGGAGGPSGCLACGLACGDAHLLWLGDEEPVLPGFLQNAASLHTLGKAREQSFLSLPIAQSYMHPISCRRTNTGTRTKMIARREAVAKPVSAPTLFLYHPRYDGRGFSRVRDSWRRYVLARELLAKLCLFDNALRWLEPEPVTD